MCSALSFQLFPARGVQSLQKICFLLLGLFLNEWFRKTKTHKYDEEWGWLQVSCLLEESSIFQALWQIDERALFFFFFTKIPSKKAHQDIVPSILLKHWNSILLCKKKGGVGINLALCLTKCLLLIDFCLTLMWLSSSILILGIFCCCCYHMVCGILSQELNPGPSCESAKSRPLDHQGIPCHQQILSFCLIVLFPPFRHPLVLITLPWLGYNRTSPKKAPITLNLQKMFGS